MVRRPVKEPANPRTEALPTVRAQMVPVSVRSRDLRRLIGIGRHCGRRGRRVSGRPKLTRHLSGGLVGSPRIVGHELFRRRLLLFGRTFHGIVLVLGLAHEGIDPCQEARIIGRRRTPGGRGARGGRTRLISTLLQVLLRVLEKLLCVL